MFHLLVVLSLTQAPLDVPPAEAPPPPVTYSPAAPAPVVSRLHLVHADPAQGSFRWREIGGGMAGVLTGYLLDVQLEYVALKLSPQATSVRWLGYDVRYTYSQSSPPLAANIFGAVSSLVLPNICGALATLWAADGPHSGGFWRALLYGYAGQLAVLGGVLVAGLALNAAGLHSDQASSIVADVAVGALIVSPGVMGSFGLHGGEDHWVEAPAVQF